MSCSPFTYNDYTKKLFIGTTDNIDVTVFDPSTGNVVDLTDAYASFYATQNWTGSYCMNKDSGVVGGISFPSASAGVLQINFSGSDTTEYTNTTRLFFNVFVSSSSSQQRNVANGTIIIQQGANYVNTSTDTDYDQGWY